jgi:hypothetical protein
MSVKRLHFVFSLKTFFYIDSTIAAYVLIIQLFSSLVNLFLHFWQNKLLTLNLLTNYVSIVYLFSSLVNP